VIFAIGDVHGCADELRLLLSRLPLADDTTVLFLGDYVDRGPDSRAVLDVVLELEQRCQVVALMGNHEEMFLDYLRDPESAKAGAFIYNGGSATLASYANAQGEVNIPPAHRELVARLELCHQDEQYFFVHAGVPLIPLAELDLRAHRHDLLWTRRPFLNTDFDWGKIIVHGHTPVRRVTVLPNRINIDTGCVFRRRLTAIALPGEQRFSVRRLDAPRRILLPDTSGRREAHRFRGTVPVEIRMRGRTFPFVTVDYSELGMYLRGLDESAPQLDAGDWIRGEVGPDPASRVEFAGVVVRRRIDDVGVHYGVKIVRSRPARGYGS
jgi:serine/threonine protein phosphatase 1